jgi:hypothetical protein
LKKYDKLTNIEFEGMYLCKAVLLMFIEPHSVNVQCSLFIVLGINSNECNLDFCLSGPRAGPVMYEIPNTIFGCFVRAIGLHFITNNGKSMYFTRSHVLVCNWMLVVRCY